MQKLFHLLHDLLPLVHQFVEERGDERADLSSFSLWLTQRALVKEKLQQTGESDPANHEVIAGMKEEMNLQIMYLLLHLARHVRSFSKDLLGLIGLSTVEDYLFLHSVSGVESMTKSQLIREGEMEFSSGIEVIKRLRKGGLVEEFADPEDGRSTRVRVTPAGREKLTAALAEMRKVAVVFPGVLEEGVRLRLYSILTQLREIHRTMAEEHYRMLEEAGKTTTPRGEDPQGVA